MPLLSVKSLTYSVIWDSFNMPQHIQSGKFWSSFPVKSWWPVQHRALYSSLWHRVAPSSGTGALQTISRFYKHRRCLTSHSPLIYFNKHREERALLLFNCSVVSDSLWPHWLQHARIPCPPLSPRACSNSLHSVGDAIQPSHPLSPPLLLLSSIFPSTRVFCSELALCNLTSYPPLIYSNRHREEHIGHISLAWPFMLCCLTYSALKLLV